MYIIMRQINLYLFILLAFIVPHTSFAQKSITLFSDTAKHVPIDAVTHIVSDDQQFIYITGNALTPVNSYYQGFAITKVDMEGHHIWTRTMNKEVDGEDVDPFVPGYNRMTYYTVHKLLLDEDYLYVFFQRAYKEDMIIAIDVHTGRTAWRIPDVWFVGSFSFLTKNSLSFIRFIHPYTNYTVVDRHTGQITFEKPLEQHRDPVPGGGYAGKDGSIYFVRSGQVTKYSGVNMDSMCWTKAFYIQHPTRNLIINHLQEMDDGYVYFYADYINMRDGACVGRFRPSDGEVDWEWLPRNSGDYWSRPVRNMKIVNDFIYLVIASPNITDVEGYHIVKINRVTGVEVWDKHYNSQGQPGPIKEESDYEFISIDIDDAGNIYATGFNGVPPNNEGKWVIAKIDKDGNMLNLQHVTDGPKDSKDDVGLHTWVIGNKVTFVGNLHAGGRTKVYLFNTDTSNTLQVTAKKPLLAHQLEPSKVQELAPVSATKYAVLKQVGTRVALELRNTANSKLLWSREYAGEQVHLAGGLGVTKDNKIYISVFSQAPGRVLADYSRMADTIFTYALDTTGQQVYRNVTPVGGEKLHTPGEIIVHNNNVVVSFLQNRGIGNYIGYQLTSNDKTGSVAAPYGFYTATEGIQSFLVKYRQDSLMSFSQENSGPVRTDVAYNVYGYGTRGDGKPTIEFLRQDYVQFYTNLSYAVPIDSISLLLLTRGSNSNLSEVVKFNMLSKKIEWQLTETKSGVTLDKATIQWPFAYISGQQDGQLMVRKINMAERQVVWEQHLPIAHAKQFYVAVDQTYNQQRGQYVVCGYIGDSTVSDPIARQPFYTIFDSTGTMVSSWTGQPDLEGRNQLNTVAINQFGQTLLGGSLYTLANHKAGVFIVADDVILPAAPEIYTICAGKDTTLVPYLDGATYKWQVDTGMGYVDVPNNNKAALKLQQVPLTANNYQYRCMVDNVVSNAYKLMVQEAVLPAVSISGDTVVNANTVGRYTTTITNGGTNQSFQWEDSTAQHTWAVIPQANNRELVYLPVAVSSKLRCVMTSDVPCASASSVISNTVGVRVNIITGTDTVPQPGVEYGVQAYPNPASNVMQVQGLRQQDEWETMELRTFQGMLLQRYNMRNQTNVSIQVQTLPPGNYILVLHSAKGKVSYLQVMKI